MLVPVLREIAVEVPEKNLASEKSGLVLRATAGVVPVLAYQEKFRDARLLPGVKTTLVTES